MIDKLEILFSTFPAPHGDVHAQLQAYAMALEGVDPVDVAEGVKAFIQGRVPGHNMAFAPSAPQLASACRRAMEARLAFLNRHRAAQRQIAQREADVEKTPESRERVKAMMGEVIAKLSVSEYPDVAENERRRIERQNRLDERFPSLIGYQAPQSDDEAAA